MNKLPLLVYEDQTSINQLKEYASLIRNNIEQVFTEFRNLDLGELDPEALPALFSNVKSFVEGKCLDKLTDLPVYGGFKVNRSAMLDQLQLPYTGRLEEAINAVKRYLSISHLALHYFSFNQGKVSIKESAFNSICDNHRVYATTKEQAEAAMLYQQYRESYIKLDQQLKLKGVSTGMSNLRRNDVFSFDHGNTDTLIFNSRFFDLIK